MNLPSTPPRPIHDRSGELFLSQNDPDASGTTSPGLGVRLRQLSETFVEKLEEDLPLPTSPDIPMGRPSPGWRDFMQKRSLKEPPPQMGPLANDTSNRATKKALSVDSPAFTPATLSVPGKTSAISSQAVNAAPFTPRGLASGKQTPQSSIVAIADKQRHRNANSPSRDRTSTFQSCADQGVHSAADLRYIYKCESHPRLCF